MREEVGKIIGYKALILLALSRPGGFHAQGIADLLRLVGKNHASSVLMAMSRLKALDFIEFDRKVNGLRGGRHQAIYKLTDKGQKICDEMLQAFDLLRSPHY